MLAGGRPGRRTAVDDSCRRPQPAAVVGEQRELRQGVELRHDGDPLWISPLSRYMLVKQAEFSPYPGSKKWGS